MKIDTPGKRVGLLLIIGSLALLLLAWLLGLIVDFRNISLFDTVDVQAYQTRGHMDAVLREWIGVCFVIAPLLICGIILLLGYGKSIGNWVKHGYYKKDEDN